MREVRADELKAAADRDGIGRRPEIADSDVIAGAGAQAEHANGVAGRKGKRFGWGESTLLDGKVEIIEQIAGRGERRIRRDRDRYSRRKNVSYLKRRA